MHRSLPRNEAGRDFFVGDIHGQYTHLFQQLARVGFNAEVDRLIATGDMIDRGEQSIETLELLEQPWFFSVLGNHEIMFLEWVLGNSAQHYRLQVMNGGEWLISHSDEALRHHAEQIVKHCPLSLSIDSAEGIVGVAHTDPLNNDWHVMQQLTRKHFNAELPCLWSRSRYQHQRMEKPVDLIAHVDMVVSGHVACEAPVWAGNQVFIDTFFRGGCLTVATIESLLHPEREIENELP